MIHDIASRCPALLRAKGDNKVNVVLLAYRETKDNDSVTDRGNTRDWVLHAT